MPYCSLKPKGAGSWLRRAVAIFSPMGTKVWYILRFNQVASFILMITLAIIFSQIRGTAKKKVGRISRMSMVTVSTLSAKLTVAPELMGKKTDIMRSATWQRGR